MTNLSELLPSGGGAKEFSAVASGTIANGQTVALNVNGTVSAVESTSVTEAVGSETVFENANTQYTAAAFDTSNNKVVIAYRDNANNGYGTAIVGTISDTSISFGSPVIFESGASVYITATFDSNANKVVIAYRDDQNNDYGTAIVGTISGTSISFGSPTVFTGSNHQGNFNSATFDSNSNKVVIAYQDGRNSDYGTAIVGTVSGTSISFGSPVVFESAITVYTAATFDSNSNKVVIAYRDDGNSSYGTAIVGTVSGTSISFGSATLFIGSRADYISATFDSNANKVVISFADDNNSQKGKAVVGTVSGTSISFGSVVVFNNAQTREMSSVYDTSASKVVIAYEDEGNSSHGTFVLGTLSGTSISFGSETVFNTATTNFFSTAFDSNLSRVVIVYRDEGNASYGTSIVLRNASTSTNVSSFIGITSEAIANTATGKVNPQGGVATSSTVTSVETYGSSQTYESAGSDYNAVVYDSNSNRVVVAYSDQGDSGKGYAAVGTVSGNSISFGTPVQFFATEVKYCSITFDPDTNQVVICFIDDANSDHGRGIVGSVDPSDNSITFGSSATFSTGITIFVAVTYDTSTNKVVCCYRNTSNSSYLEAAVGTVSGTSITFETSVTANTGTSGPNAIVFDSSNNKVVILTNEGQGKGFVGTVLGSSPWISFGSDGTFGGGNASSNISAAFDSTNNKVVVSFQDNGDNRGKCAIGTVSGTSITFGSLVEFNGSSVTNGTTTTFDSNLSKIIVAWTDQTNSYAGTAISGTVSGTSITFGTSSTWATRGDYLGSTFDTTTNQTVIVYRDVPNSQYGTAIVASTAGTPSNFVTGSTYYVQNNGNLTTTSSTVTAGKAISTTQLVLKGAS